MWMVYTFIGYMVLALLLPVVFALWPIWRMSRQSRQVTCPATNTPTLVTIDGWHAVRTHALGSDALRVRDCALWPEHRGCGQECVMHSRAAA